MQAEHFLQLLLRTELRLGGFYCEAATKKHNVFFKRLVFKNSSTKQDNSHFMHILSADNFQSMEQERAARVSFG